MDRELIERHKWNIRLQSHKGNRTNGVCRTVVSGQSAPKGIMEIVRSQIQAERTRQWCKMIDGDYTRGGFSPTMRHAR